MAETTEHPLDFEHAPEPADTDKARVWWQFDSLYEKWKRLMTDTEQRLPASRPRAARNVATSRNRISIRVDASALSMIALMLSVAAIVIVLMLPLIVDAKIQAGTAQAEATAREARTTAKMTEDKLVELRDALNAKGMNIPKLDGH